MKFRSDFVTNSSSSSFIIANEKFGSLEEVYTFVREKYLEYIEEQQRLVKYVSEHKGCGLKIRDCSYTDVRQEGTVVKYQMLSANWGQGGKVFSEELRKLFPNVEDYDYTTIITESDIPKWLKYEKYEDVLENEVEIPFVLYDITQYKDKQVADVKAFYEDDERFNSFDFEVFGEDSEMILEIAGWYLNDFALDWYLCFDCKDKAALYDMDSSMIETYLDGKYNVPDSEMLKEAKAKGVKGTVDAIRLLLGRYVVWSYDAAIPYPVAEKIAAVANKACTHMG